MALVIIVYGPCHYCLRPLSLLFMALVIIVYGPCHYCLWPLSLLFMALTQRERNASYTNTEIITKRSQMVDLNVQLCKKQSSFSRVSFSSLMAPDWYILRVEKQVPNFLCLILTLFVTNSGLWVDWCTSSFLHSYICYWELSSFALFSGADFSPPIFGSTFVLFITIIMYNLELQVKYIAAKKFIP